MLEMLVQQLKEVAHGRPENYFQVIEDLVGQIAALKDPRSISMLLPFLQDDAEYDELMFDVVHTIEIHEDRTYVREILDSLPDLYANSPRWARIIHMRILNSPSTLKEYARQIKHLSGERRHCVQRILEEIRHQRKRFDEPCKTLLGEVSDPS